MQTEYTLGTQYLVDIGNKKPVTCILVATLMKDSKQTLYFHVPTKGGYMPRTAIVCVDSGGILKGKLI